MLVACWKAKYRRSLPFFPPLTGEGGRRSDRERFYVGKCTSPYSASSTTLFAQKSERSMMRPIISFTTSMNCTAK